MRQKVCFDEHTWKNGECLIGENIFACSRKCAEKWCKKEDVDLFEIDEHKDENE